MTDAYRLLAAGAVAALFHVAPVTVARWDASGKLPVYLVLPSGHRRWHAGQVQAVLDGQPVPDVPLPELPEVTDVAGVAAVFGVDRHTVSGWARAGLLGAYRNPAGQWEFPGPVVAAVMRGVAATGQG